MRVRALVALLAALLLVAAVPAHGAGGGKKVLKIGWAQDPQTLSPFIDQDEEDFRIWAINYDLLVNFSPDDLGPAPGIAEKLGRLAGQEDRSPSSSFEGAKWSDGQPITSEGRQVQLRDARRQRPAVHQLHRQRHLDRHARRPRPSSSRPRSPTRGSSAACSSTSCPSTSGASSRSRSSRLPTGRRRRSSAAARTSSPSSSQPDHPDGAATRTSAGTKPKFDELQWIKYGSTTPSSARSRSARSTSITEVQPATFERLGKTKDIKTIKAPSPSFTELAFNLCSQEDLPGREVQPGGPGRRPCARRSPTRSTASASTRSPPATPRSRATGCCPTYYKDFYTEPARRTTRTTPTAPTQMLDAAGWTQGDGGIRDEGRPEAVVRPLRPLGVAGRTSRTRGWCDEMAKPRSASSSRSRS